MRKVSIVGSGSWALALSKVLINQKIIVKCRKLSDNNKKFGNNGLYFIPMSGPHYGKPLQVASAPNEAEITGMSFSKDFKTLFCSIQHPGEKSKSLEQLTSTWPHGKNQIPRPSVVQINGPLLEKLAGG